MIGYDGPVAANPPSRKLRVVLDAPRPSKSEWTFCDWPSMDDMLLLKISSSENISGDVRPLQARSPYVGRGGIKLEGALEHFQISPQGVVALDIGASTGGFTDCLLQRGAAKVYAIDVGLGQLAWKIRTDPRVVVREKLNARYLSRDDVPEPVDLCVIDVSFISLTLILPSAFDSVTPNGMILALIKPQFELEAREVAHGGIVREP